MMMNGKATDGEDGVPRFLSDDDTRVLDTVRRRPGISPFEISPRRRPSLKVLERLGLIYYDAWLCGWYPVTK
jgi:hypothetical protein